MYIFFTKQTIVKPVKLLVPFQDAEGTCKSAKGSLVKRGTKSLLDRGEYMN